MERAQSFLDIRDEYAFGDFQLKPMRLQSRLSQRLQNRRSKARRRELLDRNVDGDRQVLGPFARRTACFADDPFPDLENEAGFLGKGNEFRRADHAPLGMVPADERFESFEFFARQTVERLEMEFETAILDRKAQVEFHFAPQPGLFIERGLEEMEVRFAAALGPVEREIGMLQKIDTAFTIDRSDRHADAGRTVDRVAANLDLLVEAVLYSLRDRQKAFDLVLDDREHGKFVAAKPRYLRIVEFIQQAGSHLTRQNFDTQDVGAALGIGQGYKLNQDIFGAKVRLFGDVVYGDVAVPQVSVGAQYKRSLDGAVAGAVGAAHDEGVDFTLSATKLFLSHSVLVNATARLTKANQNGLLGFGSVAGDSYEAQFEGALAYQFSRRFLVGSEFRTKPDNLGLGEDDWFDVFAAYAPTDNLTLTVAYADLGSIATFTGQRGAFLQAQVAF